MSRNYDTGPNRAHVVAPSALNQTISHLLNVSGGSDDEKATPLKPLNGDKEIILVVKDPLSRGGLAFRATPKRLHLNGSELLDASLTPRERLLVEMDKMAGGLPRVFVDNDAEGEPVSMKDVPIKSLWRLVRQGRKAEPLLSELIRKNGAIIESMSERDTRRQIWRGNINEIHERVQASLDAIERNHDIFERARVALGLQAEAELDAAEDEIETKIPLHELGMRKSDGYTDEELLLSARDAGVKLEVNNLVNRRNRVLALRLLMFMHKADEIDDCARAMQRLISRHSIRKAHFANDIPLGEMYDKVVSESILLRAEENKKLARLIRERCAQDERQEMAASSTDRKAPAPAKNDRGEILALLTARIEKAKGAIGNEREMASLMREENTVLADDLVTLQELLTLQETETGELASDNAELRTAAQQFGIDLTPFPEVENTPIHDKSCNSTIKPTEIAIAPLTEEEIANTEGRKDTLRRRNNQLAALCEELDAALLDNAAASTENMTLLRRKSNLERQIEIMEKRGQQFAAQNLRLSPLVEYKRAAAAEAAEAALAAEAAAQAQAAAEEAARREQYGNGKINGHPIRTDQLQQWVVDHPAIHNVVVLRHAFKGAVDMPFICRTVEMLSKIGPVMEPDEMVTVRHQEKLRAFLVAAREMGFNRVQFDHKQDNPYGYNLLTRDADRLTIAFAWDVARDKVLIGNTEDLHSHFISGNRQFDYQR